MTTVTFLAQILAQIGMGRTGTPWYGRCLDGTTDVPVLGTKPLVGTTKPPA